MRPRKGLTAMKRHGIPGGLAPRGFMIGGGLTWAALSQRPRYRLRTEPAPANVAVASHLATLMSASRPSRRKRLLFEAGNDGPSASTITDSKGQGICGADSTCRYWISGRSFDSTRVQAMVDSTGTGRRQTGAAGVAGFGPDNRGTAGGRLKATAANSPTRRVRQSGEQR